MKRLAITIAVVLAVCMAICFASMWVVNSVLNEAHRMATDIFARMEAGDVTGAREGLVALATLWDEKASVLELLCAHDDLHEVKERIIEAEICISYTDMEDFYGSVALIGEGIEHIREKEALTPANLY